MRRVVGRVLAVAGSGKAAVTWQSLLRDLQDEYESASTATQRVELLKAYHALMDTVEAEETPSDQLSGFRQLRLKEYHLLLLRDVIIGDSICMETLIPLVRRELQAGRMKEDDELLRLALGGNSGVHPGRTELLERAAREERSIGRVAAGVGADAAAVDAARADAARADVARADVATADMAAALQATVGTASAAVSGVVEAAEDAKGDAAPESASEVPPRKRWRRILDGLLRS
jgi:hypothetical protein